MSHIEELCDKLKAYGREQYDRGTMLSKMIDIRDDEIASLEQQLADARAEVERVKVALQKLRLLVDQALNGSDDYSIGFRGGTSVSVEVVNLALSAKGASDGRE